MEDRYSSGLDELIDTLANSSPHMPTSLDFMIDVATKVGNEELAGAINKGFLPNASEEAKETALKALRTERIKHQNKKLR